MPPLICSEALNGFHTLTTSKQFTAPYYGEPAGPTLAVIQPCNVIYNWKYPFI